MNSDFKAVVKFGRGSDAQLREAEPLIDRVRQHGFVVVEDFFDKSLVARARQDVEGLYQRSKDKLADSSKHRLIHLTPSTDILTNVYGVSAPLDQLVEQILADPVTAQLVRFVGGGKPRNRDCNARIMTGIPDGDSFFNPPLEWHRDSKGEFCLAIFLSEVGASGGSATGFISGSHLFRHDPRWQLLFGEPFYRGTKAEARRRGAPPPGSPKFISHAHLNRILADSLAPRTMEATGKPGDFYLFLNDTWHSRMANRAGSRAIVVQLGFFEEGAAFPDKVEIPGEVVSVLPSAFQACYARTQGQSSDDSAYVVAIQEQQRIRGGLLFHAAHWERNVLSWLSFAPSPPALTAAARYRFGIWRHAMMDRGRAIFSAVLKRLTRGN